MQKNNGALRKRNESFNSMVKIYKQGQKKQIKKDDYKQT